MLTLTRTLKDDTLLIGEDIKIFVRSIGANQVKLSVDAPDNVEIVRGELRWRERSTNTLPDE